MFRTARTVLTMGVGMALLIAAPRMLYAASIVVNTLADPGSAVDCSLRSAITAANTLTATNGCPAGSGTDTIKFSLSGTITLGSTLPDIVHTLTIDGTGQTITISGNNSVEVMIVDSGATASLNNPDDRQRQSSLSRRGRRRFDTNGRRADGDQLHLLRQYRCPRRCHF